MITLINSKGTYGRAAVATALLFVILAVSVRAGEPSPDNEALNRLYEEIIGSIPQSGNATVDSARPQQSVSATEVPASAGAPDAAGARLISEIDNLTREAQIRHSDAVKFMQDGK